MWKSRDPTFLVPINKKMKELQDRFIRSFGGAISLWMEGGRAYVIDLEDLGKRLPEFRNETTVTIGNDFSRAAIITDPVVDEKLRKFFGCDGRLARDQLDICAKAVSNCGEEIETIIIR